jgi:hypothetical protein
VLEVDKVSVGSAACHVYDGRRHDLSRLPFEEILNVEATHTVSRGESSNINALLALKDFTLIGGIVRARVVCFAFAEDTASWLQVCFHNEHGARGIELERPHHRNGGFRS